MRYQEVFAVSSLDIWHERGEAMTDTGRDVLRSTLEQLRGKAPGKPVASTLRRRRVKPRVAKRWARRLEQHFR